MHKDNKVFFKKSILVLYIVRQNEKFPLHKLTNIKKNLFMNTIRLLIKSIQILIIFSFFLASSQTSNTSDERIFGAFKEYSKLPREICFAHLNKSTLIKGEDLGFTVYVFDKYTKKLSPSTTNVYCTIEDKNGKIIKSGLVLATEGVASNVFEIDSLLSTDNYIFKAYTNWMKNFDEENFYVQSIKVIDPENNDNKPNKLNELALDIQFLPEGGHMVKNIQNTVGVVVKDTQGYGIKNVSGRIVDTQGVEITNFKTNNFGIAKFLITPIDNEVYKSILEIAGETKELTLIPAKPLGINMNLTDLGKQVLLKLSTNPQTFSQIKNNSYKLSIHNGSQMNVLDVNFSETAEIPLLISYENLYSGINIFTLFDSKNNAILERQFFNYEGLPILNASEGLIQKDVDSVSVSIPIKGIISDQFHSFSVSVLPSDTQSYNSHQNIISNTYLKPYSNGFIEDSSYYFTNINREKKYNLDLLMLTQGWSSYDWNKIFKYPPSAKYNFETGITINAKINQSQDNKFLIYPLTNSETITLEVPNNEKSFSVEGLLPVDKERVAIAAFGKRQNATKPSLYLQFTPSKIPEITNFRYIPPFKERTFFESTTTEPLIFETGRKVEELDQVVINVQKEQQKIDNIKRRHSGTVDVLTDEMRNSNMDFASYISSKGFGVYQNGNDLTIKNLRRTSLNAEGTSPLIYLDNMLLSEFSILANYDMSRVDYVVVDKAGLGEGMRGANGVIKIFTNPQLILRDSGGGNVSQNFDIPLTFNNDKKFYVPLYTSYQNEFFQHFGVIDWFDTLKVNSQGHLNFKIAAKTNSVNVYIEGVANDGSFLSEIKTINLD